MKLMLLNQEKEAQITVQRWAVVLLTENILLLDKYKIKEKALW